MRRPVLAAFLLLVGCGSKVTSDEGSCPQHADLLDKQWFVNDVTESEDDPPFTARVDVVSVEVEGGEPLEITPLPGARDVRFVITEDMLIVRERHAEDGPVVALFPIDYHLEDYCGDPRNESPSVSDELPPDGVSWYQRRWFRVDWQKNLLAHHDWLSASAAAGHPDAVEYVPVALDYAPPELTDDHLATTVAVALDWQTLEDGTPGCAFDFPSLAPGAACPAVLVRLRYEFARL